MGAKEDFLSKLKGQFDDLNYKWSIERDRLEAKSQHATADARKLYEEKVALLRQKRDEVKERIKDLEEDTGGAWSEIKEGADKAWGAMQDAFKKARSHFD
jgi:hypothetical protein